MENAVVKPIIPNHDLTDKQIETATLKLECLKIANTYAGNYDALKSITKELITLIGAD